MTDEATVLQLPATEIAYRFIAAYRIEGFSGPETDLVINLGTEAPSASARITGDPNPALEALDRHDAIAESLMLAFVGRPRGPDPLTEIEVRAKEFSEERLKKFGPTAGYLVLEVQEKVVSRPANARDFGQGIIAIDAVDRAALRIQHQPLVDAALVAAALSLDRSPDVVRIKEGVSLFLPDGRPLHSVSFKGNAPKLIVGRRPTPDDALAIGQRVAALIRDERLTTPSRLLADALRRIDDRLESFLFAWAALEILLKKYTPAAESGQWANAVPLARRAAANQVHASFEAQNRKDYSLGQRVRAFSLMHGIDDAEVLAQEINVLRRQYREPLYHEGRLQEQSLPVEAVVGLVRRLLASIINNSSVDESR